MRKSILLILALLLIAPVAFGLDMTPEQAMQRMMNCVSCKPFSEHPELGASLRYDIFETSNGFVSAFMLADEKLVPALRECDKKCEATRAEAMKIPPEQREEKLCPFCAGMFEIAPRSDVKLEEFKTHLGTMLIASSTTEEGVKALHGYATMARATSDLLDKAAAEMDSSR